MEILFFERHLWLKTKGRSVRYLLIEHPYAVQGTRDGLFDEHRANVTQSNKGQSMSSNLTDRAFTASPQTRLFDQPPQSCVFRVRAPISHPLDWTTLLLP